MIMEAMITKRLAFKNWGFEVVKPQILPDSLVITHKYSPPKGKDAKKRKTGS